MRTGRGASAVRRGAGLRGVVSGILHKLDAWVGAGAFAAARPENPRWCAVRGGVLAGRRLFLDPDAGAYQTAMLEGVFERFVVEGVEECRPEGRVIYDIGAHIGFHALQFACLAGGAGRVVAFEPHAGHRARIEPHLREHVDLAARVRVVPFALDATSGSKRFFQTDGIEAGSSSASHLEGASKPVLFGREVPGEVVEVATLTLDEAIRRHGLPPPDIVKMDVEGAEGAVLAGARDTVRARRPAFLIEVHSASNMLEVARELMPQGYTIDRIGGDGQRVFVAA